MIEILAHNVKRSHLTILCLKFFSSTPFYFKVWTRLELVHVNVFEPV